MAKETKKLESEKIEFLKEDAEIIFTDVVQINVSQETVVLELSLRDVGKNTATVTHRVYMTLPHFIRFADAVGNLSNQVKESLEESNESDAS